MPEWNCTLLDQRFTWVRALLPVLFGPTFGVFTYVALPVLVCGNPHVVYNALIHKQIGYARKWRAPRQLTTDHHEITTTGHDRLDYTTSSLE